MIDTAPVYATWFAGQVRAYSQLNAADDDHDIWDDMGRELDLSSWVWRQLRGDDDDSLTNYRRPDTLADLSAAGRSGARPPIYTAAGATRDRR